MGYDLYAVLGEDGELEEDRFFLLAPSVVAYLEQASRGTRLLYVEAEFFGGTGDQGAAGWEDGRLELAPRFSHHPPRRRGAINEGLRWLGVRARWARDQFEAVGLHERCRWEPEDDEEWEP
jgi:hypothetical protein